MPPSTVETAALCPNGVAIVETKLSFLNSLVMNAPGEEIRSVFSRAADEAVRTGQPVAIYTTP